MKAFLSGFLFFISCNVASEVVTQSGSITLLLADAATNGGPGTWFTLDNLTQADDCKTASNGSVILYISDDVQGQRQYSLALAAFAANQDVLVRVDSSQKHPFHADRCMVKYIAFQR